jgi:23S rRNA pseudouridine1911/1915/1917 synthase
MNSIYGEGSLLDEAWRTVLETDRWVVVEKSRGMNTAPLAAGEKNDLAAQVIARFPEIADAGEAGSGEGGLLHRLDRETSGLVLFARDKDAFRKLRGAQNAGKMIKEYGALCVGTGPAAFSEWPFVGSLREVGSAPLSPGESIGSAFRAYGPGRVRVAPLPPTDPRSKRIYRTEVLEFAPRKDGLYAARISLRIGFRHQVRCHLAASGFPIAGDPLYAPPGTGSYPRMLLHASRISFPDPATGRIVVVDSPVPFRYP